MKPFLVIQLRPEDRAADGEFAAILDKGGLDPAQVRRVQLDREDLPRIELDDYSGIIVGGGPGCVTDDPTTRKPEEARAERAILSLMPEITRRDVPFLGCCYGIGILAAHLGGEVAKGRYAEPVGPTDARVTPEGRADPLLADVPDDFTIFVGHKEALQSLPRDCVHLVEGSACPFQMIRHGRNVYATQFHPEADGRVFADRIEVYGGAGYFPEDEAERLTEVCLAAQAEDAPRILRNFVRRYG